MKIIDLKKILQFAFKFFNPQFLNSSKIDKNYPDFFVLGERMICQRYWRNDFEWFVVKYGLLYAPAIVFKIKY